MSFTNTDEGPSVDFEDEIAHGMAVSYSEISNPSSETSFAVKSNVSFIDELSFGCRISEGVKQCEEFFIDRPNRLSCDNDVKKSVVQADSSQQKSSYKALKFLNLLDGTVTQDGDMVLFVAEDLETKIKLSSPVTKKEEENVWANSWSVKIPPYNQITPFDVNILNDLEVEASKIATSVDTLTENLAEIIHSISALTVDCLETYRAVVCKTCDAVDLNIKKMDCQIDPKKYESVTEIFFAMIV